MSGELPRATPDGFYRRVNQTFEKMGLAMRIFVDARRTPFKSNTRGVVMT